MAVSALCLVFYACVSLLYRVEATSDTLSSLDASFCHGGLKVIYPVLDIDKCLVIPKDPNLRREISTVWKAPKVYFPQAQKGRMYVLVMVDPDAPRRNSPTSAYWRHWLVVDIQRAWDVSMQACETEIEESSMRGAHSFSHRAPVPQLPLQWRDLGRVSSLHLFPQAEQLPQ
uniref:phosphatidylethanolamine-binding protein 4 isoform X2 n=1 Tax=Scatophagus argus TaxID=75038 RepID=UPI001ED82BB7|nr:phosphatidylethanolamine-binding protein 4 isoform X2 [Scatophagus argus]